MRTRALRVRSHELARSGATSTRELMSSAGGPAQQSLHVGGVLQNAGALHRFGTLGAGRHGTGFFKRGQRFGFEIELGAGVLDRSGHDTGLDGYRELFSERVPGAVAREGGGSGSPPPQATASDSMGSIASIRVSVWAHLGHS